MKKGLRVLAAIAATAVLLSGCAGTKIPVSGPQATPPAKSAKPVKTVVPQPTPTASGAEPTSTPAASPSPTSEPPAAYTFPMPAAKLFGADPLPDGFSSPVYLTGDGQTVLYATKDNCLFRAQWDGIDYSLMPVAENVNVKLPSTATVDGLGGTLFCQGSRLYPGGGSGPCVVMVNLADGSRCNVDDYVGWKESGFMLSPAFQYFGGLLLSQVEQDIDGKLTPVDRWAILDIARRTYTVLDLSAFREKNLPQWQEISSMKLALVGESKLLAVCLAQGSIPSATGSTANENAQANFVFLLDMNGNVLKNTPISPDAGNPELLSGISVKASPDGKYLLYCSSKTAGVFLFSLDKCVETMISESAGAGMAFSQWGKGGVIYYGLSGKTASQGVTVYQTSVEQIISQK